MKNKWKRFVAVIISMAMIFMMAPVTAFAADAQIQPSGAGARGIVDQLGDTTLYYPNYFGGAEDWDNYHDPSSYVVNVGEQGKVQNLQTFSQACRYCGAIAIEDSAVAYAIPSLSYDTSILGDCSVSLAPYESEDAEDQSYAGIPCVQFNYTGIKAGTTTVEFDEYFYVNSQGGSGYCNSCRRYLSFDPVDGYAKVHISFEVTVKESIVEHELYVPVGYEGEMDFTAYSSITESYCELSDLTSDSNDEAIASAVSEVKDFGGIPAAAVTIRGESVGDTIVRVTYMAKDSAGNLQQHTEHIYVHVYEPYKMELESGSSDDFIHSIRQEGQAVDADMIVVDEEPHVISGDTIISVDKYGNDWKTNVDDGSGQTGSVSFKVTANQEGTGTVKSVFGYYNELEDGSQSIHMFVDVLNVTVKDSTPYFYVYHSATGETAKIELTEEIQFDGYDLTGQVPGGYLYGGVYKDQNFSEPYTADDADEYGNGLAFMPKNGETYYLREVDDAYLDIQNLWTKDARGELKRSYLVAVVDGNYYQKVGFAYGEDLEDFPEDISELTEPLDDDKVYSSITVTETKNGQPVSTEYTPEKQFGLSGYFAVSSDIGASSLYATPYWVTQDGVRVTGCEVRKLTDGRKDGDDRFYGSNVSYFEDVGVGMSLLRVQSAFFMGDEEAKEDDFVITKYDGESVEEQNVQSGDNTGSITYAGKENCRFAGWFLDKEYTQAADFSNVSGDMTVYAKYVTDEYLKAKIQTVTSKKIITKLRTTTVVDEKQYGEVGFDYICGEEASGVEIKTYRTLVSGQRADKFFGGEIPKTAYMLYNDLAVKDLPDGTEITLTPYWITLDGTRVTGTSRTVIYHGNSIELKEN